MFRFLPAPCVPEAGASRVPQSVLYPSYVSEPALAVSPLSPLRSRAPFGNLPCTLPTFPYLIPDSALNPPAFPYLVPDSALNPPTFPHLVPHSVLFFCPGKNAFRVRGKIAIPIRTCRRVRGKIACLQARCGKITGKLRENYWKIPEIPENYGKITGNLRGNPGKLQEIPRKSVNIPVKFR